MRTIIKNILKWFLHEHDYEIERRIGTRLERSTDKNNSINGWVEERWIYLKWFKKCKTCGHTTTQSFRNNH